MVLHWNVPQACGVAVVQLPAPLQVVEGVKVVPSLLHEAGTQMWVEPTL